jgi:hypothetical protein
MLLTILAASIVVAAQDKPVAIMTDQFGATGCEDVLARIQGFDQLVLEKTPRATGFIVIFPQSGTEKRTFYGIEWMVRGALTYIRNPRNRYLLLHAKPVSEWRVELWLVPPGAEKPVFSEAVWSYELKKTIKYYDSNDSVGPCPEAPEEMFSAILNENPTLRGHVSITERSERKYRNLLGEMKTKLASIPTSRLRFFRRRDCFRDTCGRYQLWLIPGK